MSGKPLHKRILFVLSHLGVYFKILSYKLNCFIEAKKGLDFSRVETITALGLPENSWGYETSGNKYLHTVLKDLNINKSDSIIDIGCGKGHALYFFSKYPFNKIAGIEFSERLSKIAVNNMKILNIKNVQIEKMDATLFNDYKSFNYFYLYNPFRLEVMEKVVQKIETTLINDNRTIIIIYKNPLCHQSIIKNKIFKKISEFPSEYKNINFFVYKN